MSDPTCPQCGADLVDVTSAGDPMQRVQCFECGHEGLVPCEEHTALLVRTHEDVAAGLDRYLCQFCGAEWPEPMEEPAGPCPRA